MVSSSGKPHDHCKGSADTTEVVSERQEDVDDEEEKCLDMASEADDFDRDNVDKGVGLANGFVEFEVLRAEDVLHMEFNNPQEASHFYNEYGRAKGFSIRQGKKLKNSKGEFIQYTYLCNRQGFRDKKWLEKSDRKRVHKVVTRCGCLAEMRIKRRAGSGKWYVSRFVDEHNHGDVPARYPLGLERVVNQTGDMPLGSEGVVNHTGDMLLGPERAVNLTSDVTELYKTRETCSDMVIEANDFDRDNIDKCVGLTDGIVESEVLRAEDALQMEFNNPQEASHFYNEYGRAKGFTVREGKKVKNSKGEVVRYTYLCNREGFRDKRWLEKSDRKREHRAQTRCGCLAEMRIKRKAGSGKWYVSRFVEEHNHEVLSARYLLGPERVVNQTSDVTELYRTRVDAFVQLCKRLAKAACLTDEDYKLYTDKVLRDAIFLEMKNGSGVEVVRGNNANAELVKDPGTKGTGRASEVSASKGTKRRKCSTWGRLGHRRTRYLNGMPSAALPAEDAVRDSTGLMLQNGEMGQQEFVKRRRTVDLLASFPKFL
ncbi:hypothetical protein PIB30_116796 [Stylosanthes scabra]|uniref:FAR1 domain-containing protein n=2 Tax=Stylosanthes scabra TaxID=79078 RepID=A0ABU6Q4B5_9FABA|nr:hypothetical protein [Stylosanthes scabra]